MTPSTLLVQGDTVTVAGSGFPGNSLVGIIQCRLPTAGVQDCNMSSLAYTNTDSAGTFSTSYTPPPHPLRGRLTDRLRRRRLRARSGSAT